MTLIQGAIRIQARWTFQGWVFSLFETGVRVSSPSESRWLTSCLKWENKKPFQTESVGVFFCFFFENVAITCYVNVLPWLYWNTTALLGLQSSLFKRLWHRLSRSHHWWIVRPFLEMKALINDHCEREKGVLIVKCSHIYFKSIWICCLFHTHPQRWNDKPLD